MRPTSTDGHMGRSLRLFAHITNWGAALWRQHLDRQLLKATVFALQELDARTLRDIGVARSEIESAMLLGRASAGP